MGFVLGLGSVLLLAHLYLYWRLVHCTGTGRRWRLGGAVGIAALFVIVLTSLVTQRSGPREYLMPLHAVGMTWMAAVAYLILLLLVVEVLRLVLLALRRRGDGPQRLRLARGAAALVVVITVAVVGYGVTQALGPIRTVQARIVIPDLPEQFDGYRIGLATDLHLGALNGRDRTQRVVDLLNEADVDIVALVGDLSDGLPSQLVAATEPLTELTAPDGVLFTTGNHEYYFDAAAWRAALPGLQVELLHNESRPITRGDQQLLFAGINDYTGDEFGDAADLDVALTDRRPTDVVVLLAHQPRQVHDAAAAGVDLQLSGHTHGGQFWPFHLAVQAQQGTLAGLSRLGDTQVWTTRGAGFWGPPVRVGAPPDVSIITLARQ